MGVYGEDQRAWWGPPQAGLVDEFADVEDGYGFLIESTQYATRHSARRRSRSPPASSTSRLMQGFKNGATFIGLLRDRGAGMVVARRRRPGRAALLAHRRARRAQRQARDRGPDPAAPRRRRARDRGAGRRPAALASRPGPRGLRRALPARAAARRWLPPLRRPPDGHLPHGRRPADQRGEPLRRAARHAGRLDRRHVRLPDLFRHQSDDHRDGPRPPHRGRDRRRAGSHPRTSATAPVSG